MKMDYDVHRKVIYLQSLHCPICFNRKVISHISSNHIFSCLFSEKIFLANSVCTLVFNAICNWYNFVPWTEFTSFFSQILRKKTKGILTRYIHSTYVLNPMLYVNHVKIRKGLRYPTKYMRLINAVSLSHF